MKKFFALALLLPGFAFADGRSNPDVEDQGIWWGATIEQESFAKHLYSSLDRPEWRRGEGGLPDFTVAPGILAYKVFFKTPERPIESNFGFTCVLLDPNVSGGGGLFTESNDGDVQVNCAITGRAGEGETVYEGDTRIDRNIYDLRAIGGEELALEFSNIVRAYDPDGMVMLKDVDDNSRALEKSRVEFRCPAANDCVIEGYKTLQYKDFRE
jgi:hypothetical protein